MLTVMGKYGDLCQLEELHLRNLGMGSLLILLPFAPHVRRLEPQIDPSVKLCNHGEGPY